MGVNFGNLGQKDLARTVLEPGRLFSALPKADGRFGYARDIQKEVWDQWHARRTESDVVIKMNTGSGKTVVGLIMLRSRLNEGTGPAVYVAPDPYLAKQVTETASGLGIAVTDEPDDAGFRSGRSVLVTHIHRLFNGQSVFGTKRGARTIANVGTYLIDDAHACIATTEDQFTLRLERDHKLYGELLRLFADDLKRQSRSAFYELKDGKSQPALLVPWWAWIDRQDVVARMLSEHLDEKESKFVSPLISDSLPYCSAAFAGNALEIRPQALPIEEVPSFPAAGQRIYLTATLADDSALVTHFGADPARLGAPITPTTARDMGDRLILTPYDSFKNVTLAEIQTDLRKIADSYNVVVIVPSNYQATAWEHFSDKTLTAANLQSGVAELTSGHVGLVVLVNKYDGVDLPDGACRVLAIDGLPQFRGPLRSVESAALLQSPALAARQVQRIEQGMGRGVRSNTDYCCVLLLGSKLTQHLYDNRSSGQFGPATQAQLDLSDQVAAELTDAPLSQLTSVINQCLGRDPDWLAASKAALDDVEYAERLSISIEAAARREAFDAARRGDTATACSKLEGASRAATDPAVAGLLLQEAAAYRHFSNPVSAQEMQGAATKLNSALLKPIAGVAYVKLRSGDDQAARLAGFLASNFHDQKALRLRYEAVLSDLQFSPDQAQVKLAEQAFLDLGQLLGFEAQRPERDIGTGPDGLWHIGDNRYLVVELKTGTTTGAIARKDIEQLSHSMDWFSGEYGDGHTAIPIIIHAAATLRPDASARPGARVMVEAQLDALKNSASSFSLAISENSAWKDPAALRAQLASAQLLGNQVVAKWTSSLT